MDAISYPGTIARPSLDCVLESAVVLSWNELMPNAIPGMIQVEYHTGAERFLEYLKVWASTGRGYWNLVCEYWNCSLWSHVPGITFGEGYGPGSFSLRLKNVMQHEDHFDKAPDHNGLILIYPPNAIESRAAETWKESLVA